MLPPQPPSSSAGTGSPDRSFDLYRKLARNRRRPAPCRNVYDPPRPPAARIRRCMVNSSDTSSSPVAGRLRPHPAAQPRMHAKRTDYARRRQELYRQRPSPPVPATHAARCRGRSSVVVWNADARTLDGGAGGACGSLHRKDSGSENSGRRGCFRKRYGPPPLLPALGPF